MIQGFSSGLLNRELIYQTDLPSFQRDFASLKSLDHGTGPNITFTRGSNATYFDADGTLQTASNDVPRFDHSQDGSASSLGLLIEEQRTNSIRNSQAGGSTNGVIGSGGALPTNMTGGANLNGVSTEVIGTGTENGLSYVDYKISGTPSANGTTFLNFEASNQVPASSGQTWTQSAYVKLAAGSATNATVRIVLGSRNSGGTPQELGTTATFTPTSSSLVSQRRSVTHAYTDALTAFAYSDVRVVYTSGNPIDLTLRIAAPQLEQGAFATSYIPTTTAAATRAADSAVVTPISSFYNQAEGTLFAEGSTNGSGGDNAVLFAFDDTTADERVMLRRSNSANGAAMVIADNGTVVVNTTTGSWSALSTGKAAFAYKQDDAAISFNGGAVATDTSATMATVTHMKIGNGLSSVPANGHIRKLAYWPKRLTNTLLEQLTT